MTLAQGCVCRAGRKRNRQVISETWLVLIIIIIFMGNFGFHVEENKIRK